MALESAILSRRYMAFGLTRHCLGQAFYIATVLLSTAANKSVKTDASPQASYHSD